MRGLTPRARICQQKDSARVKTIPRAERTVLALIWLLLDRDLRLRLSREHPRWPLSPDQAWGRAWTRHSSKETRAASLPLACACALGGKRLCKHATLV